MVVLVCNQHHLDRMFRLLDIILLLVILSPLSASVSDLAGEQQHQQQQSEDVVSVNELLEPTVSLFRGVLPPQVCKELISRGEREGFNVFAESIDDMEEGYKASGQSIDVYERNCKFIHCSMCNSPKN
jgi:hypothetical protein